MVTVARLEFGICKDPGFAPASVHLVFFVLRASETGLLLMVKLGRSNVVIMPAGVNIMHQRKKMKTICHIVKDIKQ